MKLLKIMLGSTGILLSAILLAIVASHYFIPDDVPIVIICLGLMALGIFLVLKRNVPLTRRTKQNLTFCFLILFGCFVFVAAPNFIRARTMSCCNACLNNLRQIDGAMNQFALEHNLTNGSPIHFPDDLTNYIKLNSAGKIPLCPAGGTYTCSVVGTPPTCSIGNTMGTQGHVLP